MQTLIRRFTYKITVETETGIMVHYAENEAAAKKATQSGGTYAPCDPFAITETVYNTVKAS